MTRLEKFNEMREAFKNELLKTFPEISDRPAAINGLMGSRLHEDCEGLKCPEDGDCDKCPLKYYWKEEYGIEIGDEVWCNDGTITYVVMCFYNNDRTHAVCIASDGAWFIFRVDDLQTTGRHFPEIKEVLKKLQGGRKEE